MGIRDDFGCLKLKSTCRMMGQVPFNTFGFLWLVSYLESLGLYIEPSFRINNLQTVLYITLIKDRTVLIFYEVCLGLNLTNGLLSFGYFEHIS